MKRTYPTLQSSARARTVFAPGWRRSAAARCSRRAAPRAARASDRLTDAAASARTRAAAPLSAPRHGAFEARLSRAGAGSTARYCSLIAAPAARIPAVSAIVIGAQGDAARGRSQPAAPRAARDRARGAPGARALRRDRARAKRRAGAPKSRCRRRRSCGACSSGCSTATRDEDACCSPLCAAISTRCARCSARIAASIRAAPITRARRSSGTARCTALARRAPRLCAATRIIRAATTRSPDRRLPPAHHPRRRSRPSWTPNA